MKHEKYYLTGADGNQHEVSEEIFRAYKHMEWNENAQYKRERMPRYQRNEQGEEVGDSYSKVVSVDSMIAGGGEHHLGVVPAFSDEIVKAYEEAEMLQILSKAIEEFEGEYLDLYTRLFVEGISEREYEKLYGMPRKTVAYKKKKMLAYLKELILNKI